MDERKPYWDISVLYVEDEESVRSKIIDFFELRVGNLYLADNGFDGLELYRQHTPDIVVSDVKMPKMSGLDMAREIKAFDPEARIIITSAFNDQDFLFSAIEVGVYRYVLKPIRREFMKKALEDCVEQIRLKRLKKEQRDRTKTLLEMQDNIVIMTNGQKIEYANHAFLEFFNVKTLDEFLLDNECVCDYFEQAPGYLERSADKTTWLKQLLDNTEQGNESKAKMQNQTFLVRHKELEAQMWVISFTNISMLERHQLELEKKHLEQEKLLVQQGKMAEIGNLIGAIIHQWKQPLNVIALLASSLVDRNGDAREHSHDTLIEIEETLNKQVRFMADTMDDFKNYFSPSKNETFFNLHKLFENTLGLLQFRTEKERVTVVYDAQNALELFGYENELKQVIFNIVNNALDAIKEARQASGRISLVATLHEEKHLVEIVIEDNGGGIPESLLPDKLFDTHLTTKGEAGTGIGLSISKNIIEQRFNGTISAENREDGARFKIVFPMRKEG